MAPTLESTTTFSRAMFRALRDSNETEQLLVGEEISSVGRMSALVPLLQASAEGRAILEERPRISTTDVDFDRLRSLPPGTLGRAFVEHLDRCGLDPDTMTVAVSRGPTEQANYLLTRVRQTHDIWHTLLGLGAQGHEEVLVHAFQWPQLRMPYSALVVGFGTLKHFIGEGRLAALRHCIPEAYRAGRDAQPLLPVYWERHWEQPVAALRERYGIRPASRWRGPALS